MPRLVFQSAVAVLAIFAMTPAAPNASAVPSAAGYASALCLEAAQVAAARHGIPNRIMQAIMLVETRRAIDGASGPWPWTLNIGGKGYWFETRAEALAHAEREIAAGRRSVDLGCFQVNYRWHGENFDALDDMLEPVMSAEYAARFLGQLFAETGDWMRAAGLYHSRTPVLSRRYRSLVGRALARLDRAPSVLAAPEPRPRVVSPPRAMTTRAALARVAPAQGEPARAIGLATARNVSDPARSAAPGAVMLRMFSQPAHPLLTAPRVKS